MTYILHNRDGSGGFAVEAALVLAKVPFELIPLESLPGTPLPETFQTINPWGQVPVLILPDGSRITESAAMLIHLSLCYPHAGLGPVPATSEYAQFLRWILFANINLYENILRRTYSSRYTDDAGIRALQRTAQQRIQKALSLFETTIAMSSSSYLVGKTLSVADIYLAMLYHWCQVEGQWPKLDQLHHHVMTHTMIMPLWQRHFARTAT